MKNIFLFYWRILVDLASTNAEQLAQPFVNSNRTVYMDRYFASYSTVEYFLEHGLTAIGTLFAHRRYVLACVRKAAQRDFYSTLR
ncbi:hypothetical protein T05_15145 [Trichinella murrelli]|uniref:PiggyBac transposable element-derived protein domain-containing protein n=1 Tax=Trichinella murrelli TaxID=144512 RepID=A0A0V0TAD3_9BILA|nr:hypothetical protein T05_15145 [Trichinella murrelli]